MVIRGLNVNARLMRTEIDLNLDDCEHLVFLKANQLNQSYRVILDLKLGPISDQSKFALRKCSHSFRGDLSLHSTGSHSDR